MSQENTRQLSFVNNHSGTSKNVTVQVQNARMDIHARRKDNLRRLINQMFEGNIARCARALGMKPTQISRWLSDAKSRQNIHESSARAIEHTLGIDFLWLDKEPEGYGPIENGTDHGIREPPPILTARQRVVLAILNGLTDEQADKWIREGQETEQQNRELLEKLKPLMQRKGMGAG